MNNYTQKPRNSGDSHAHDRIAVLDIETHVPDYEGEGFPAWPMHWPICASVLTADSYEDGVVSFTLQTIMFPNREVDALVELELLLSDRTLVTFNGRGFDLPVLALTAMKHRKFDALNLSSLWRAKAVPMHLPEYAASLAIPAKTGLSSKAIGYAAEAGEWDVVRPRAEEDVVTTAILLGRHLASNRMVACTGLSCDLAIAKSIIATHAHLPFVTDHLIKWRNGRELILAFKSGAAQVAKNEEE